MKKITYIAIAALLASLSACDIDEVYKTQLDQDVVYTTTAGYDGLINACYENLYYMYGKEDGIPMMEMGTDLWQNGSATSAAWKECVNNYEWNTETGVNRVVWNALYATIAYCNTAIFYQNECPAYDPAAMKAKVAEAHFMRGFSYFHVVEQWGGVTLTTTSMAEEGAREYAYRSTEDEIYDQVISDLMIAYSDLPESQGQERGRANKYAAAAMLCKAWIQRSRLERDFAENPDGKSKWVSVITNEGHVKYSAAQCADSAFKYAQIVINSGKYQLYPSDETSSGSTKEWLGDNNKANSEFIFLEAIDHENGYNPEVWNRGRTRQYYMMNIGSQASNFGVQGDGIRYGRANTSRVHPTLFLLHDCFDPKPSETDVNSTIYCDDKSREWTADTRFDDSFYYKYFISSGSFPVPYSILKSCGKDTTYFWDAYQTSGMESRYTITGNIVSPEQLRANYSGYNYYADNGTMASTEVIELENKPAALGCYTPNFPVDSAWCARKKYLVAGLPSLDGAINTGIFAYFQTNGATAKESNYRSLSPSLRKLSPLKYIMTNQQSLNDFPIIRLTDIYLLAAEASILSGSHQSEGLEYLKTVRRHAAKSTNEAKILEGVELTIDYLAKERARELCAENWRWYDLKRMGLLTADYLNAPRRNVYGQSYQTKWRVRPIPQQMLDQIANPDEYGTNGY
ncbi:MAG: RagB/SusD family nutrient uptake outer membrane protein [Bacteroidales bacterium]|nr:RagB/SusD family nutrient uptake outer membrane protein [Bacteroidales bacterium]